MPYGYKETDYDTLYANIATARKNALDAALAQSQDNIANQTGALGQQYNTMRGQAYTNARISALGNNEQLAATGLAGNAYASPQSGYSETSRILQDAALGNALNTANMQEQTARNNLTLQGNQAVFNRDQQWGQTSSDLDSQKANAKEQQSQFMANLTAQEAAQALQQKQFDETVNQNEKDNKARDDAAKAAAQQAALAAAYQEVATFGRVMTDTTAALLHVAKGTKMSVPHSSGTGNNNFFKQLDAMGYWIDANGHIAVKPPKGAETAISGGTAPKRSDFPPGSVGDTVYQQALAAWNSSHNSKPISGGTAPKRSDFPPGSAGDTIYQQVLAAWNVSHR